MALTVQTPNAAWRGSCHDRHDQPFLTTTPAYKKQPSKSRFAIALSLFFLINLTSWALNFGKGKPTDFGELTWTGWTIKDFLGLNEHTNLVFFGSSLVLVPVAGADADFLNKRLDGSRHHHSVYFESAFKEHTGRGIKTFNFSLPGEMPSDAYLATNFLLKGLKQPNVIVWGLGPRDFMDNLLPSPSSTDPFHNLSRFGDIGSISHRVMPDWLDRFNFLLGRLLYFYGNKVDLAGQLAPSYHLVFDKYLPAPSAGRTFSIFDRRNLLPDYKPCELAPGEAYFRPQSPKERAQFVDNLAEYRKRYRSVKWDTFITQMEFLADTLDLAKARGIHVVLVTMPITAVNRSLIKDYVWDAYLFSVRALARSKGASLVDLYSNQMFMQSDFMDTVHLHSGGGKKMLDVLIDKMSRDRAVRLALGMGAIDATNTSKMQGQHGYFAPGLSGLKKQPL